MTYIDYLNQFHRWHENNNPGDKLIVLYLNMLDMFNRRYWLEWAGVTTQQLMVLANTDRKQTALDARNALVRAGLIEYRRGNKGKPTTYRLLELNFNPATENRAEPELGNEFETENRTAPIKNKTKTRPKTKTKDGGTPETPAPVRHKYGKYKRVLLSDEEGRKLVEKLGREEANRCVHHIDEYLEIHGNKCGWKSTSHYLVLLKCSREQWGVRPGANPVNGNQGAGLFDAAASRLEEQYDSP